MATVRVVQCCNRSLKPISAQSMFMALGNGGRHQGSWETPSDSDIGRSRSFQASQFLWSPHLGEVLVFVDDDIGFGVEDFNRLIDLCLQTQEISCGMYVVRDIASAHPALALFPGQKADSLGTAPLPIWRAANGFMAIHRQVLERLETEFPWGHDIPVYSGPRWMNPFFLEFVHEGEYLSEDWAFTERARVLGIKTWLDPRIKLSHLGDRAYTIRDLEANALTQMVTVTIDEGGPDPTGVVDDLRDFLKLKTRLEAWQLIVQTSLRTPIAAEWQAQKPQTPYQVNQFYSNSPHYLLELAKFNTDGQYGIRANPAVRHYKTKVIDFGGGIGTLSLQLTKMGRQVTYVDLPSLHRQFAEFRFHRRHAEIRVASNLVELGDASHDCLVAADVMEHIHPDLLPGVVEEMWRVLEPGGIAIAINDFGHTEEQPYHFGTEDLFNELMLVQGFEQQGAIWAKPAGVPAQAQIPAMTAA